MQFQVHGLLNQPKSPSLKDWILPESILWLKRINYLCFYLYGGYCLSVKYKLMTKLTSILIIHGILVYIEYRSMRGAIIIRVAI